MLKRIPHDSQEISGESRTEEYVQSHQKYAQTQFKAFTAELSRQLQSLSLTRGRFLEIGSGPGFLTAMVAEKYPQAEINALELSDDMISVAMKVVGQTQPASRVRFIKGDIGDGDNLRMRHLGKFDLVYSTPCETGD